ncbi:BrnT family toxin [Treponema parvum]|uniref:BrnT family toxin n=1 Tax=Treponema parvum TaxID=138851 RepID=A0A975EZ76_9SPIR|nr:BrnT family toxin [Treponema parvum]QTQ11403.1 BrnT family toxin [Treponema parvum]QTQ17418.1 BrnT family toxin [Treponema parvum]
MPKGDLIIKGRFEWFSEKNELNIKNHGFSFEQILDVFSDSHFYEIYDNLHSTSDQDRYLGLGCTNGIFVIAASYTENDRIHLISARLASPKEKKIYDIYCRKING